MASLSLIVSFWHFSHNYTRFNRTRNSLLLRGHSKLLTQFYVIVCCINNSIKSILDIFLFYSCEAERSYIEVFLVFYDSKNLHGSKTDRKKTLTLITHVA